MTRPAPTAVAYAIYCLAHVGKSLLWAASDLLTLYVLVTLYHMDPAAAGLLFLVALGANAGADLAVATWLDRHPGHAAALAGTGLVVSALTFPGTILLAPYGNGAVLAAMLVFRIAYAGYDVPHNALMSRLVPDPRRAAWLSRGRTIGTGIAGLAAAAITQFATDPASVAVSLWGLAGTAVLIGAVLLPLLRTTPAAPTMPRAGIGTVLPVAFLAASVIGIVALAALGKAVLHAPIARSDPGPILVLLTLGRTASALVPLRIVDTRQGLILLSFAYLAAAGLCAGFMAGVTTGMLVALGAAMGLTNLIGWALLPSLARGARGYGLYTMASKLSLGAAGLALAYGLGRAPTFGRHGFVLFALAVAGACCGASLLAWPRLTSRRLHGLSGP